MVSYVAAEGDRKVGEGVAGHVMISVETHGKVTVQKRGEEECRQGGVGGYVSGGMYDRQDRQ